MSEPLKPCAHCGGIPISIDYEYGEWVIYCTECGVTTDTCFNLANATAVWNRRALSPVMILQSWMGGPNTDPETRAHLEALLASAQAVMASKEKP